MLSKICNFISKYMAGIVIVVAAMAGDVRHGSDPGPT